ncbi:phage terminase large subunit [Fictibacillus sp. NRS-1165]|uniref:phage terminase large subunit n=1 Tax=Fictibacillus sp. NRS-1165 TaxID=3144463 RepID=UPI003D220F34
MVDGAPSQGRVVRYWDLAATEPAPGKDPAYTAGVKVLEQDGQYWIMDVVRTQATPKNVENLIHQTAMIDGKGVEIWMEQEPGSSGVNTIDHYRRQVLKGFAFYADKVTGNKELRANPLSSAAEAGNVFLISGDWNGDFLDEAAGFPYGKKDQVDAASAAYSKLHEIKDQRFAVKPTIAGFKRR